MGIHGIPMFLPHHSSPRAHERITPVVLALALTALDASPILTQSARTQSPTKSNLPSAEATPSDLLRLGIAAYKKRDYVGARESFLLAFQKEPLAAVAAMLADAEMKLEGFRDAAEHWSIYLNSLEPKQDDERADVLEQLANCRKHVGALNAPAACKRIPGEVREMDRTADISNYALVGAGIVGAATLGAYLLWPKAKSESPARTGLIVSPWWTSSSQGIAANLGF